MSQSVTVRSQSGHSGFQRRQCQSKRLPKKVLLPLLMRIQPQQTNHVSAYANDLHPQQQVRRQLLTE